MFLQSWVCQRLKIHDYADKLFIKYEGIIVTDAVEDNNGT